MNEFVALSSQKRTELENLQKEHFDNWISIAAINYEKQT
jgi:hypothetical protein